MENASTGVEMRDAGRDGVFTDGAKATDASSKAANGSSSHSDATCDVVDVEEGWGPAYMPSAGNSSQEGNEGNDGIGRSSGSEIDDQERNNR